MEPLGCRCRQGRPPDFEHARSVPDRTVISSESRSFTGRHVGADLRRARSERPRRRPP